MALKLGVILEGAWIGVTLLPAPLTAQGVRVFSHLFCARRKPSVFFNRITHPHGR